MKKSNDRISLHRPEYRANGMTPRFGAAKPERQQLLREIYDLEAQLEQARTAESAVDRTMIQSCQEMIRSRRELYRQLDN